MKTYVRYVWPLLIFIAGFAFHAFLSKMGPITPTYPKTDNSVLEGTVQSLTDELATAQTENACLLSELERKESSISTVVSAPVEYKSTGVASAFQDHEERISEMMATAQLSQIAPKLGLTEPQKDQVYAIYYNQAQQTSEGFIGPEQIHESQSKANEQIQEILTDEQSEVFKTIRDNQNFGNFTIITR